jgi:hypothetical protein
MGVILLQVSSLAYSSRAGHLLGVLLSLFCTCGKVQIKVRIPIAMQRDMRQRYFTSVFPMIAAQRDFWRHFFIPENIATSFPPALSRRFAI